MYAENLRTATWKDLRRVGFSNVFAKTLVKLRASADWNVDKIWLLKKHGGLGLRPDHYHALRYVKITDDDQRLNMALFLQKNQKVCVTHTCISKF